MIAEWEYSIFLKQQDNYVKDKSIETRDGISQNKVV